jgi:hypothetical protein
MFEYLTGSSFLGIIEGKDTANEKELLHVRLCVTPFSRILC